MLQAQRGSDHAPKGVTPHRNVGHPEQAGGGLSFYASDSKPIVSVFSADGSIDEQLGIEINITFKCRLPCT